ncbi:peptide ABC transporter ATPase [Endozoicomonas sp. SM1973]|uniref:Peptide ABC transporter ATPase n=1 Tax=Spartinivicinus marinus TaxID=2994442 RepID=A0A853I9A8_9GAMM|nr:peptide ABC transporter ATPase [Spartinivicinus marinus]
MADRHNLIHPVEQPELWAKSVTRQRVSDLFRFNPNRADNLTPFTKHWQQIQQEVNRAVNGYSNIATEEGKSAFRDIATAIVKAARHAQFDFPEHTLKFTNDMPWLKIARVNGNLVIRSGQQLIKP